MKLNIIQHLLTSDPLVVGLLVLPHEQRLCMPLSYGHSLKLRSKGMTWLHRVTWSLWRCYHVLMLVWLYSPHLVLPARPIIATGKRSVITRYMLVGFHYRYATVLNAFPNCGVEYGGTSVFAHSVGEGCCAYLISKSLSTCGPRTRPNGDGAEPVL